MRTVKKGTEKRKPDRRQIGVKLNSDLWREMRVLALQRDRTAGELLEEAMREYLEKQRKP
jgi:predicted transcriptional regulator